MEGLQIPYVQPQPPPPPPSIESCWPDEEPGILFNTIKKNQKESEIEISE